MHSFVTSLVRRPNCITSFSKQIDVPEQYCDLIDLRRAVDLPSMLRAVVRALSDGYTRWQVYPERMFDLVRWAAQSAQCRLRELVSDFPRVEQGLRRSYLFIDLMATNLCGFVSDEVYRRGFDDLNEERYVDWLTRHGAAPATCESALVRGLHDFVFATGTGHPIKWDLAAGVALHLSLRTAVGYRGAMMYKMAAGMGDVVFAPLYEVLRRRGVKFQFFHSVRRLVVDPVHMTLDRIEFERQATPRSGGYDPLVNVRGIQCWPSTPRWEQLPGINATPEGWESPTRKNSSAESVVLRHRHDFEFVVAALPLDVMRLSERTWPVPIGVTS